MAKWPYGTSQWQKLRTLKLMDCPLCEDCKASGRLVPASHVDHRLAISQGGDPFPALDELASLCARCHSLKTARGPEAGAVQAKRGKGCSADGTPLDRVHPWNGGNGKISRLIIDRRMPPDLKPSLIPLTIVCGPPGSGKSTYVRTHAAPGDLVICLDTIMQELSGLPEHHAGLPWLGKAMEERNRLLRSLAKPGRHPAAWFIVTAPVAREREQWAARLKGKLIVLDTPATECIRRVKADPRRKEHETRMIKAILEWWEANPHLTNKWRAAPRFE